MRIFSYSTLIREHHLDSFGHVNNAVYLELMEEARWELITQGGYSISDVQTEKRGPVILEVNVKFMKELRVREKIRIDTQCINYSKVVAELEQKIWNEANELCTHAHFKFGLFDLERRKLIKPTEKWLRALGL
ncbi:MAG: acyl-CoA thioesterase [Proteobacteria bacterium]|nr:acyl-CoA thioesterase [Pseudomonadota bacterium]NDG25574.1 acyl-CoA thioesterase [Pseudomonadota bacterium]